MNFLFLSTNLRRAPILATNALRGLTAKRRASPRPLPCALRCYFITEFRLQTHLESPPLFELLSVLRSSFFKSSVVCLLLQGTYSAAGASECTSCTAGRYTSSTGQTSCVTCDAGSYAAASGASQCTACAGGQYQHASGESSCLACSKGYACPSGSASMAACTSGTYAPAGSASCTACSLGTYQPNSAEPSCLACAAGTYCGTVGLDAPTGDCAAGSYAASGATACTACAVGTSQGFAARSSCDACARGEVRVECQDAHALVSFPFRQQRQLRASTRACVRSSISSRYAFLLRVF